MRIESISVSAGRTIPHPLHSFANIKATITITAELEKGDDLDSSARLLQADADRLVEEHCKAAGVFAKSYQQVMYSHPYVPDPCPVQQPEPWQPCPAKNDKDQQCNRVADHEGDHDFELPF